MLQDKRRTNMKSPLYTGLAVALNIVVCGVCESCTDYGMGATSDISQSYDNY